MKDSQNEILLRFNLVILLAILVGLAIVVKASVIMFAERDYWRDAAATFVKEDVPIPAVRGNILSADGQLMASSLPEYKIYMDFMVNKVKGETPVQKNRRLKAQHKKDSLLNLELDNIAKGLHEIFPDKPSSYFKQNLLKGRKEESKHWLIYPNRISYIQFKQVKQLPIFNLGRYAGGLHETKFNLRKKPFGSLAQRTLGDMYADVQLGAKNGIELAYDTILKGKDGMTHRQKVMNKYINLIDTPPVDGCDIVTTIDVGMQDIVEKALVDKLKELNATVGVAMLMEVKTGEIKAISSMSRIREGVFAEINSNAISDLMEPGSTFKTASMLVALDDGKITPDQTVDTGNGMYNMHGSIMKDHNYARGGYQVITATKALMVSSNIGVSRLIDESYHSQPEKFVDGLYRVGIAEPLNLKLPGAANPRVRRPTKENWSKTALAWMSIGYETQIPPISTLAFYNGIANGGKMLKPLFVKEIRKDGAVVEKYEAEVIRKQMANPVALRQIQEMLREVVRDGLAKQAGSPYFPVSGKTGTAQVSSGKEGYTNVRKYLVSFCGYFPSDNPKYTCLVAIQKNGLPASGGGMAGPVFKNIAERVMAKHIAKNPEEAKDSLSIMMPNVKNGNIVAANYVLKRIDIDTKGLGFVWNNNNLIWGEAVTEDNDVKLVAAEHEEKKVPNVIGMGARDAVYRLESEGLKVRLSGIGKVKSQSLHPGSVLVKGQTVNLRLN